MVFLFIFFFLTVAFKFLFLSSITLSLMAVVGWVLGWFEYFRMSFMLCIILSWLFLFDFELGLW